MKKLLITILIIVILAGAGYFVYTKDLVNLGFLQRSNSAPIVEEIKDVKEEQKTDESIVKIDPQILGKYFTPHAAPAYIILKSDGTFFESEKTTKYDVSNLVSVKARGKFFLDGTKIKFVYDDKYPDMILDLIHTNDDPHNWYIKGQGDAPKGWAGYYMVHQQADCTYLTEDIIDSSNLANKNSLYKLSKEQEGKYIYNFRVRKDTSGKNVYEENPNKIFTLIDSIENGIMRINLRIGPTVDEKGDIISNGGTVAWLELDIDKETLADITITNEGENGTLLDFDKDRVDELKIACKK